MLGSRERLTPPPVDAVVAARDSPYPPTPKQLAPAMDSGERFFEPALPACLQQPFLRIAGVELPLRALGLILGGLQRETLTSDGFVVVHEFADRLGGRGEAIRGDNLEQDVDHLSRNCGSYRLPDKGLDARIGAKPAARC
jgi:hypothetical protein